MVLTVEQIGYCERISESAVQYAERLLATKPELTATAKEVARQLVYEYKDHSFVIDREEAEKLLGQFWIVGQSSEQKFGEAVYEKLSYIDILLEFIQGKQLQVTGSLLDDFWIWKRQNS